LKRATEFTAPSKVPGLKPDSPLSLKGIFLNKAKVLLVDDDPVILAAVSEFMRLEGHTVLQASTLKAAISIMEREAPDLGVVYYDLPDGDALQYLAAVKTAHPTMKNIVLTGHGTIDLAVRAIKEGA